ncbi:transposase [Streptomyces sp. NPDC002814]
MGNRPWILDDELWALMEPLLPPWPQKAPGPKPVDDRLCLQSILYVLYNDVSWQLLPLELRFARGRPAGADSGGGTRPGPSTSCTAYCTRPTHWTGPGPACRQPGRPRRRPGRPPR